MPRWICAALVAVLLSLPGPVLASGGGGKADGNLIRIVVMLPLRADDGSDIIKIIPITLDLNMETPEVKDQLVNQMPKLQDAFLSGSYGKIFTNWGYDKIQALMTGILHDALDEEIRDKVHLSIRVNVRPQ